MHITIVHMRWVTSFFQFNRVKHMNMLQILCVMEFNENEVLWMYQSLVTRQLRGSTEQIICKTPRFLSTNTLKNHAWDAWSCLNEVGVGQVRILCHVKENSYEVGYEMLCKHDVFNVSCWNDISYRCMNL